MDSQLLSNAVVFVSLLATIIATLVNYRQQQGREKGVARDDLRADYARVRDERDGLLKRIEELEAEVKFLRGLAIAPRQP